jgi:hypothetical protein
LLKGHRHLFVEYVGVARRRLDVSVTESSLHQLQVASIAKQLRAHVVSNVVKAEVLSACLLAEPTPLRFRTTYC